MSRKFILIIWISLFSLTYGLNAQYDEQDSTYNKYFIGSTFFMLGNFAKVNRPDFIQLNLGYRITGKDVLTIECKTWKYAWPLGIPYGKSYEAPEEKFPGYIREFGIVIAYQRFLWKGMYVGIDMMNTKQNFYNEEGIKIDNGYQLFNTYRFGYHIKLFKNKFFIEPSIAITHRPYHTDMPDSFQSLDNKWNKFLLGEPGLHFGFNF